MNASYISANKIHKCTSTYKNKQVANELKKCKGLRSHLYMKKPIVWAWSKTSLKMISRWASIQTNYSQTRTATICQNTSFFSSSSSFNCSEISSSCIRDTKNRKRKKDEKKSFDIYQLLDPLHFSAESDPRDANRKQRAVFRSNRPLS